MKKMFYSIFVILVLSLCSIVKAQNIAVDDIIAKFQAVNGYSVTNSVDNSSFTVNTGTNSIEFSYSASDNILTYDAGSGKDVKTAVETDVVLGYIVELSSNKEAYVAAKAANPKSEGVDYGTGCDLTNMGFCYDSSSGKMQIVLSDQFTTYLYNYYTGGNVIDGSAAVASTDPLSEDGTGDSKNPDTGSFTEVGIIIALLALLLAVVYLKRRNETEFKI